jgi:tRNA threonylcarbamoyladenosine modification (KEOPS) complex  Pcc1 subunit
MSNWERREADTLADAIGKHVKANPELVKENRLLSVIKLSVDAASTTVNTSAADLSRYRAEVCAICRGSTLYECDVAEGWSSACAFVFTNASEFAAFD